MKVFYSVLFVAILLMIGACDPTSCLDQLSPSHGYWVSCYGFPQAAPTLMDYDLGGEASYVGHPPSDFNPNDYACDNGPNSDPVPLSSEAVYPTGNNQGPHLTAHATATGNAAYLPRPVLALPFFVQPSASDPIASAAACDPSQPDVLQVGHLIDKVTRIGTCPFSIKAVIPTVTRPLQVAITPDGTTALVTSFDNAINFINLATNQVTYTLQTDPSVNPNGIAITPDGSTIYITSYNTTNHVLQAIDYASHQVTATINMPAIYPQTPFVTPDGSQVWVTFPLGNWIAVVDRLTNTIATLIPIPQAYGIAFDSTGSHAYVTSWSSNPGVVDVVDASTYAITKSYTVGAGPVDIRLAYGDRYLLVNNNQGNSVSVVDTLTGKVSTQNLGGPPMGLAIVK